MLVVAFREEFGENLYQVVAYHYHFAKTVRKNILLFAQAISEKG